MTNFRSLYLLDQERKPSVRAAVGDEKSMCCFGETVGILGFRPWYGIVGQKGHVMNATSYDFPVRIGFVEDPFDPQGFTEGPCENRGWQLNHWIDAALQMQEDGVRAIVCGCGLTGTMQSILQSAVEIPVYTSTMLFVNQFCHGQIGGKRVGILTVSEDYLVAHNRILFKECGVSDKTPVAIAGMEESAYVDGWAALYSMDYDYESAAKCLLEEACRLKARHPDIGGFLLECTEMPVFSDALREATSLPVWDAVDMVQQVHDMHSA
jgi:Asp/Glu/hydantoin racemase